MVWWKLNKAIYGLRSSPKAWQSHLAETLQQLGMVRLASEPNVYRTATGDAFVLCYVDDLLFLGTAKAVNTLFSKIQQQLLLRQTGDLTVGNTVSFLRRNTSNRGDYYRVSLADSYTTDLLKEADMLNCNAAPAPGTKAASSEMEQPLTKEQHSAYRRAVARMQWMTYTRPDISYATKELARSLTGPTTADQQKLKHLLRFTTIYQRHATLQTLRATNSPINGRSTRYRRVRGQPLGRLFKNEEVNNRIRDQAHGFNNTLRQPHTIALSSAEVELYAINTGAKEALHIRNLLQEALNIKKMNILIHTESSSGKSMATRIGSAKKANHIELKHRFIQQLVQHDLVRIIKINTANNTTDIFTEYVSTETLLRHLMMLGSSPSIASKSRTHQQEFHHYRSNSAIMQRARACDVYSVRSAHTHKHTLNRAMVLTKVSSIFYILFILILQYRVFQHDLFCRIPLQHDRRT